MLQSGNLLPSEGRGDLGAHLVCFSSLGDDSTVLPVVYLMSKRSGVINYIKYITIYESNSCFLSFVHDNFC